MLTTLNDQKKELFTVQNDLGLSGTLPPEEFKRREAELERECSEHDSIMNERRREQYDLEQAIDGLRARELALDD